MAAIRGAELEEVFRKASKHVKERAKASGASLYYMKNGKRIREAPDGKKYVRVMDLDGNLKEYPFK